MLNRELASDSKRTEAHFIIPTSIDILCDDDKITSMGNKVIMHRLDRIDGDAAIRKIEQGIKGRKAISKKEILNTVFYPICASKFDKIQRVKKAIEIAGSISNNDYEDSITILALLYIFVPTYFNVFEKGSINDLFTKTKLAD